MKPWRKSFGIWVPDRALRDNRGFISPGIIGAVAGARRRTGTFSPWQIGINFRQTSGYVTDGTNETYCVGDAYSTSRGDCGGGVAAVFGWESGFSAGNTRDRNAVVDRRLAGINFDTTTVNAVFRLDLPSAGTYEIRLALGDASTSLYKGGLVKDDTTTVITIANGSSGSAAEYYDASDTLRTYLTWPGSNSAQSVNFSSTILRYAMGATASTNVIAHLFAKRTA